MKTFLLIATCCILGGCGQYGEPIWLAQLYDRQDPCQSRNWKENGGHMDLSGVERGELSGYPHFCGAGGNVRRTTIYTMDGRPTGYVRTR